MTATNDPDTMYVHQARKQTDWHEFKRAMSIELQAHIKNNSFTLIKLTSVQPNTPILPAI